MRKKKRQREKKNRERRDDMTSVAFMDLPPYLR